MQYVLIKYIKYSLDSFSQNLKWWNASDFILSGVFFSFSGHLISNLWTVPELGVWGSQGLITLHWELVGRGRAVYVWVFVMCECLFWQLCGCFGNMCTCIYCVFLLILYVYLFLFFTSLRTTATNWKLNFSK
jgi:hypothetical protein